MNLSDHKAREQVSKQANGDLDEEIRLLEMLGLM